MRKQVQDIKRQLSQPWLIAVLICTAIPIFPEYFAPLLAMSSMFLAFYDMKQTKRTYQLGLVGKFMVLYIAYIFINLFYSIDPYSTLSTLGMWVSMFCVYLTLTAVVINRHRFDTAILCVCIVGGMLGLIAIIQYVLIAVVGLDVPPAFWHYADEEILTRLNMRVMLNFFDDRVASTFNNPNVFAEYSVMIFPFVAYYAFKGKRSKANFLCKLYLLAIVGGVAFTFSRASYLAILAIVLVFAILNVKKISTVIMSVAASILIVPESVFTRLVSSISVDNSTLTRFNIWHVGLKSVLESPIFGYGAGTGTTWSLLLQNSIDIPHMHNLILQLLSEGGLISLALFALMGWSILRTGLDILLKDKAEYRVLGTAIIAFVAGFFINGLFDFPLMTPKLVGTFITVIAFADIASALFLEKALTSISKPEKNKHEEESSYSHGGVYHTNTQNK